MRRVQGCGIPMEFSPALLAFIRDNIISVEQIRVLLLLSDDPQRSWTAQEISATLTSTRRSILHRLSLLVARGLVKREPDERYHYASDLERDALVAELRRELATRPVSVIGVIFSQRNRALESFSDAFLLGSEDHDS
ncbi:MAG TPA: hypothetical protein VMF11_01355 [Candidatus Baltobacteraceae bacterium]|nr:hypothetical protein [Candidatus Baltobacteraceae bacterium]